MLPLALAPKIFFPQTYWPSAKAPAVSKLPPESTACPWNPGCESCMRVDFDDAAHFSAVFGGNSRGVDAHGLHVVGFDLRAEAGRAIVGKRNAVDDELRLIFGAARMQNRIAFIEPAGLGD